MNDETIDVLDPESGAYIELFTRDGVPVARMNYFDKDVPLPLAQLTLYRNALNAAIEKMRPPGPTVTDDTTRCAICGWPLKETWRDGCVRGSCAMRPFPSSYYAPDRAKQEYLSVGIPLA